jgi:hypothetical protein
MPGSACRNHKCSKVTAPDLFASFPKTADGLPIIMQSSAGLSSGRAALLAYDSTLNTPATDWARCLDLVVGCARSDGAPAAPCLASLPRCPVAGGACCPAECMDAFSAALVDSSDETAALQASFFKGDCVPGLSAYRDQEVQP